MKRHKTMTEYQREEANQVVRSVLLGEYLGLELVQLSIREDLAEGVTNVSCKLLLGEEKLTIKGSGSGPVDALFTAMVKRFSNEYCSLENLCFSRFSVEADIDKNLKPSKTDSSVEATLEIDNDCSSLLFRERASSISVVSAKVILSAIEHFINAEKCVIMLYNNLQYARDRRRGDMVNIYTQRLTEVVRNVSYEKVINKCKENKR